MNKSEIQGNMYKQNKHIKFRIIGHSFHMFGNKLQIDCKYEKSETA